MYDNLKMKKCVIITGGNKGIGLDITNAFLKKNFYVIILARTNINNTLLKNPNIKFFKADCTKEESFKAPIKFAVKKFKKIDTFINNVGMSEWKPIEKIDKKFLDKILFTNLYSYFWGCKFAAKYLKEYGSIINISSIAGKRGSKNNSAYSASKFAVNGLTQSLSKELGYKNIRVNAICPVLILTDGLKKALKSKFSPSNKNTEIFLNEFAMNQSSLNRMPLGSEIASVCLFLSSNKSSAITGQCINVDCGVFPQ